MTVGFWDLETQVDKHNLTGDALKNYLKQNTKAVTIQTLTDLELLHPMSVQTIEGYDCFEQFFDSGRVSEVDEWVDFNLSFDGYCMIQQYLRFNFEAVQESLATLKPYQYTATINAQAGIYQIRVCVLRDGEAKEVKFTDDLLRLGLQGTIKEWGEQFFKEHPEFFPMLKHFSHPEKYLKLEHEDFYKPGWMDKDSPIHDLAILYGKFDVYLLACVHHTMCAMLPHIGECLTAPSYFYKIMCYFVENKRKSPSWNPTKEYVMAKKKADSLYVKYYSIFPPINFSEMYMAVASYKRNHPPMGYEMQVVGETKNGKPKREFVCVDRSLQLALEHTSVRAGVVIAKIGEYRDVFCIDYSSAYPAMKVFGWCPFGQPLFFLRRETQDPFVLKNRVLKRPKNMMCFLYGSFRFKLKEHGIPTLNVRDLESDDYRKSMHDALNVKEGKTCVRFWMEQEFEELKHHYEITEENFYYEMYFRQKQGEASVYYQYVYNQKDYYSKTEHRSEALRSLFKMGMNSVHGKDGFKTDRAFRTVMDEMGITKPQREFGQYAESEFFMPAFIATMSQNRTKLMRHARLLQEAGGLVVAGDTDSLRVVGLTLEQIKEVLGEDFCDDEENTEPEKLLGKFTFEGKFDNCKVGGFKAYICYDDDRKRTKSALAGFPKSKKFKAQREKMMMETPAKVGSVYEMEVNTKMSGVYSIVVGYPVRKHREIVPTTV